MLKIITRKFLSFFGLLADNLLADLFLKPVGFVRVTQDRAIDR